MRYCLFFLPILFFTSCNLNDSKKIAVEKSLSRENCTFQIPEGKNVVCGYVSAPENYSQTSGAKVQLAVAVIQSTASNKKEPIIYLEGGPGGSAIDNPENWLNFGIADDRDLIIYDQRGTGRSLPFLDCEESGSSTYRELGKLCRDELLASGIDTDFYNTRNSTNDLETIRKQLGIDRWIVYGISYGTALAQDYARTYPEYIHAVVIDSVLPLNHHFFSENINKIPAAFDTLFNACAEESECNNAYPALKSTFLSMVASLNTTPKLLTYEDLETETVTGTFQLTGKLFADMLWKSMYVTELIDYLPYLIFNEASNGYTTSRLLYSAFYGGEGRADSPMSCTCPSCATTSLRSTHLQICRAVF